MQVPRLCFRTAPFWVLLLGVLPVFAQRGASSPGKSRLPEPEKLERPLTFEPNRGQADPTTAFLARTRQGTFLLSRSGIALGRPVRNCLRTDPQPLVSWDGAGEGRPLEGALPLRGRAHYYEGGAAGRCIENVPFFEAVRCVALYPGVDAVYYANRNRLEYDLIVAPGADPAQIKMRVERPTRATVSPQGDLILERDHVRLVQHCPRVYQRDGTGTRLVSGGYRIESRPGGHPGEETRYVSFTVGEYDRTQSLVIDPTIEHATYYGSGGSDTIRAVVSPAEPAGNRIIFAAGNRGNVAMLAGFDLSQLGPNTLLFESFIGSAGDTVANGLALDEDGNPYLVGRADGAALPVRSPIFPNQPGPDAFLGRFRRSGELGDFLTYLGGESTDEAAAVFVDDDDSIYVAGTTDSDNFATAGEGFRNNKRAGKDGFLCRILQPAHQYSYATCFGGNGDDAIRSMVGGINGDGDTALFCTGSTTSTRFFPLAADGAVGDRSFQRDKVGGTDAFAFNLLRNAGTNTFRLLWSTYLGGSGTDVGNSIFTTDQSTAFVCGITGSVDFPHPNSPGIRGANDAFVTHITAGGTRLSASRFLGGTGTETARSMTRAVGQILVTGSTTSTNFPVVAPLSVGQALNLASGDTTQTDAFVTLLDVNSLALSFSSFLGGTASDHGFAAGAFRNGDPVVAGATFSVNFPNTDDAFQESLAGDADAFLVLINRNPLPGAGAGLFGFWNPLRQRSIGARSPLSMIQGVFSVQSQGLDPAPRSILRIFRSQDDRLDPSDTRLLDIRVPPVGVGETRELPVRFSLRGPVTGQRLIGVVDATNVIPEPLEDNNVIVSPPLQ